MIEPETDSVMVWDPMMLSRYDVRGPRYTAYPGAHCFDATFDQEKYEKSLEHVAWNEGAISLYVHLPFCFDICYYCACNKIVTRDRAEVDRYLVYLKKEIQQLAAALHQSSPKKKKITALHFGGGTPNYLEASQLTELIYELSNAFELDDSDDREFSIEVDPRLADPDIVTLLAGLGFNRISFGVQDFHPEVQLAVNRKQSFEQCETLVNTARDIGIRSINIDLMYGLPEQTRSRFSRTIEQVIKLSPDRIALYNYAHMPDRFSSQRQIDRMRLPDAHTKLQLLCDSAQALEASGYRFLGMDHFAKVGGDLDLAERSGKLVRNFQGYSVQHSEYSLAVGVSAISSLDDCYVQNHHDLKAYYAALDNNEPVIERGVNLTPDDYIRRAVIMALLCKLRVDKHQFEVDFQVAFEEYFEAQSAPLSRLAEDGLLTVDEQFITVSPVGRLFLRNICMLFDASLTDGKGDAPAPPQRSDASSRGGLKTRKNKPTGTRFSNTL